MMENLWNSKDSFTKMLMQINFFDDVAERCNHLLREVACCRSS